MYAECGEFVSHSIAHCLVLLAPAYPTSFAAVEFANMQSHALFRAVVSNAYYCPIVEASDKTRGIVKAHNLFVCQRLGIVFHGQRRDVPTFEPLEPVRSLLSVV